MKKFISMVMAAAMVVSLVPATAFAASGDVVAKSVKVVDKATDLVEDGVVAMVKGASSTAQADIEAPVLTFKIDDAEAANDGTITQEVKIKLDGAKFTTWDSTNSKYINVEDVTDAGVKGLVDDLDDEYEALWTGFASAAAGSYSTGDLVVTLKKISNTSVTFELTGSEYNWQTTFVTPNEAVKVALQSKLNKDNAGSQAKVTVTSDIVGLELKDVVYAAVEGKGITAELEDDVVDVIPEETVVIEDIAIEATVGSEMGDVFDNNDVLKLKLSKGFEFAYDGNAKLYYGNGNNVAAITSNPFWTIDESCYVDNDVIEIVLSDSATSRDALATDYTITGLKVVADDAKAGDEATLTVDLADNDAVKVVVAKVVESGLVISVDEDEDVPVMWSGTDYENTGLTADNDEHVSLEVTIKETFEEAYSDKDEIELTLPEGVYVVSANGVKVTDYEGPNNDTKIKGEFEKAYREGEFKSFIFERNAFTESRVDTTGFEAIEFSFELTLVADPGFVGEVPMTMLVDGEEVGTVVIAKFEAPMVVEAEQNDLKIDYRNTAVGSDIVVKEAEAGLWAKNTTVELAIEDGKMIEFEKDATFTVNEDDSDMEIKDSTKDGKLAFTVKKVSDDEAAVVTISDMELYMGRSLAAGAYDLTMTSNTCVTEYLADVLFAAEAHATGCAGLEAHKTDAATACDKDHNVYDVSDYSDVVKEAFVNIVTAGREQDDASFTTKVVVPVGESYIIAGENTVALDVPAYVSAAGYTMLPVRAVATALGINNNNVLWDAATKTVTILYGQRIITMQVGAKVINVNGSAIPASASVEVVNGRTFLPMRDLATALGVTDITWDAATKTATLNGNI